MAFFQTGISLIGGTVVCGGGAVVKNVHIHERKIVRGGVGAKIVIDASSLFLTPGLIDIQINGWGGSEFAESFRALASARKELPAYGVTSFVPTACTMSLDRYQQLTAAFQEGGGAEILGWHLEGPFINPAYAGIHPKEHIAPHFDEAFWRNIFTKKAVRIMTLAPEYAPDALFDLLTEYGVSMAIGHSSANSEQLQYAQQMGVSFVTHLFNAMSSFHHRNPGIIGAVLGARMFGCTIISDLYHVHKEAIQMAWRCHRGRLALISDGASLMGSDTISGTFLGNRVVVSDEALVTVSDGKLAGSIVPLDGQVRRLMEAVGCSFAMAVRAATEVPAIFAGIQKKKGRIADGMDGDVAIWEKTSRGYEVLATLVQGEIVFAKPEFWNRVREV